MTALEELLRSTLLDPARELPAPPDSIDIAVRRVSHLRRRRLTLVAAVAASTLALVTAGLVVADVGEHDRGAPAGGQQRATPVATGTPDADVVRRLALPLEGIAGLALDAQAVYAFGGSPAQGRFGIVRVERSTGQVVRQVTLPNLPTTVALGPADTLWLTTSGDAFSAYTLLQLDRRTLAVLRTVQLPVDPPQVVAVSGQTLWAGAESTLYRLDADDGRVLSRLHLGRPIFGLTVDPSGQVLYARVADELRGAVIALDARTGRQLARRGLDDPSVAPVGAALWAASGSGDGPSDIYRLDRRTLAEREPGDIGQLHDRGLRVWPGGEELWVTNARRALLTCVDPASGTVLGVRRLETGTLVADAEALYAVTSDGLLQVAPSSVCRR